MALEPYTAAFHRYAETLTDTERSTRAAQFAQFLATGFPDAEQEDWRYTDLSSRTNAGYVLGAAEPDLAPDWLRARCLDDAERLVYLNGRLNTALSTESRWHAALTAPTTLAEGLIALNAAFADGGLNLTLGRGAQLAAPLQVLIATQAGAEATMTHQRHRITLGENAEATVLLQFCGDGGARLSTQQLDIELAAGAKLNLYRVQHESAGATLITQTLVTQQRDSRLNAVTIDLGDAYVRHDLRSVLNAPGAEADFSGLYAPAGSGHIDNHTWAVHAAPHGRSRSHYRGIIDERAKAVYVGKVVVEPDAQKTDSEQRIANLLLSRRAEVNAKPELEIYADDVKCAHGATVGQLDETALGYLRSRGIPLEAARALLLRAFAAEILDRIAWPALASQIAAALRLPEALPVAEETP